MFIGEINLRQADVFSERFSSQAEHGSERQPFNSFIFNSNVAKVAKLNLCRAEKKLHSDRHLKIQIATFKIKVQVNLVAKIRSGNTRRLRYFPHKRSIERICSSSACVIGAQYPSSGWFFLVVTQKESGRIFGKLVQRSRKEMWLRGRPRDWRDENRRRAETIASRSPDSDSLIIPLHTQTLGRPPPQPENQQARDDWEKGCGHVHRNASPNSPCANARGPEWFRQRRCALPPRWSAPSGTNGWTARRRSRSLQKNKEIRIRKFFNKMLFIMLKYFILCVWSARVAYFRVFTQVQRPQIAIKWLFSALNILMLTISFNFLLSWVFYACKK